MQCVMRYVEGKIQLWADGSFVLPEALVPYVSLVSEQASGVCYEAEARHYHQVVMVAYECSEFSFQDEARGYAVERLAWAHAIVPRSYQKAAMAAWQKARGRGCVVLPTGAGKTIIGCMAIAAIQRTSLVVVPTIDLLRQWQEILQKAFAVDVGVWGGGQKSLAAITIITYDSARMVMRELGLRFGLVIFDECHHLGAPFYRNIAAHAIAPYRLGLTATFERQDGEEVWVRELVGERVYEASIADMPSQVLSPYTIITCEVALSVEEKRRFQRNRSLYVNYLKKSGISVKERGFWQKFIISASRSEDGRHAMHAYRIQKSIAYNSKAKIRLIGELLWRHKGERILIFTHDNGLAYRIGIQYFLPVITYHTKTQERREILAAFKQGTLSCVVTSRVLNEGVDVPEASVGIVVSGSGSVREHVQRLGRILRHRKGKKAKLYELISSGTGEQSTKQRRRQHDAYQRMPSL